MSNRIFHISEQAGISHFDPRPSPSNFEMINGNVVFGISEELLHNYLLPRDCPRVTYYCGPKTSEADRALFFGNTTADYVVAVETAWYPAIIRTILHCYEFSSETFTLLDECAGYYISYQPVTPISVTIFTNPVAELLKRNIELRLMPDLRPLADAVRQSTLNFSLIRMRNAGKGII